LVNVKEVAKEDRDTRQQSTGKQKKPYTGGVVSGEKTHDGGQRMN